jgi:hypothetical protein
MYKNFLNRIGRLPSTSHNREKLDTYLVIKGFAYDDIFICPPPFFIFYKRKISARMPKFLLKKLEGKGFGFPSKHAGCTGNQGTRSAYAVYR